jgi:hypothetical protein
MERRHSLPRDTAMEGQLVAVAMINISEQPSVMVCEERGVFC